MYLPPFLMKREVSSSLHVQIPKKLGILPKLITHALSTVKIEDHFFQLSQACENVVNLYFGCTCVVSLTDNGTYQKCFPFAVQRLSNREKALNSRWGH